MSVLPAKPLTVLLLLCLSFPICYGQRPKEDSRLCFQSINQVGLIEGETGRSWQWQTINGVKLKSWFAGIGAGMDYYRFRGIPVFADIRKTFGHSKNKVFAYADGGLFYSRVTEKEKDNYGYDDRFSKGLYLDGGIGYQIRISRRNALLFSLGYSYKNIKETFSILVPLYFDYYPPGTPGPFNSQNPTDTYNYHLKRLSMKIGWAF